MQEVKLVPVCNQHRHRNKHHHLCHHLPWRFRESIISEMCLLLLLLPMPPTHLLQKLLSPVIPPPLQPLQVPPRTTTTLTTLPTAPPGDYLPGAFDIRHNNGRIYTFPWFTLKVTPKQYQEELNAELNASCRAKCVIHKYAKSLYIYM